MVNSIDGRRYIVDAEIFSATTRWLLRSVTYKTRVLRIVGSLRHVHRI